MSDELGRPIVSKGVYILGQIGITITYVVDNPIIVRRQRHTFETRTIMLAMNLAAEQVTYEADGPSLDRAHRAHWQRIVH